MLCILLLNSSILASDNLGDGLDSAGISNGGLVIIGDGIQVLVTYFSSGAKTGGTADVQRLTIEGTGDPELSSDVSLLK